MSAERLLTAGQLDSVFELLLTKGKAHTIENLGEFGERFETARRAILNVLRKDVIFKSRQDGVNAVIFPPKDTGLDSYQAIFLYGGSKLFSTEVRLAVFSEEGNLISAQAIVLHEIPDEGISSWSIKGAKMTPGIIEPIRERTLLPSFVDFLETYGDLLTGDVDSV